VSALPQGKRYRAEYIASPKMLPVNAHEAMMLSSLGGKMKTKMTHAMRMEFANAIRGRYLACHHASLRIPHVWPPVTFLVRQPVTELREATRTA
jgi:hypothetical protein